MDRGEVWLARLSDKHGKEQHGQRPVVVMAQPVEGLVVVVPLTSNTAASRYEHAHAIKPSETNHLQADSVALVFQIQSIDERRLIHTIGSLDSHDQERLDEFLRRLMKL